MSRARFSQPGQVGLPPGAICGGAFISAQNLIVAPGPTIGDGN